MRRYIDKSFFFSIYISINFTFPLFRFEVSVLLYFFLLILLIFEAKSYDICHSFSLSPPGIYYDVRRKIIADPHIVPKWK